jgi:S1-C subfamily serine protease
VGDSAKKQVKVTLIETDRRNDLALLKMALSGDEVYSCFKYSDGNWH